nr:copper resistance protein NlpE [uncultured Flavobacterium sp.]
MNFRNQLLSLSIVVVSLTSCGFKDKDKEPVYIEPLLLDTIFSNSYKGIIPCPDCAGIETTLKIFKDSTISRTVYYQGKDELPITRTGTWKLKDSIFEAKFDREKLFYKIKSGDLILRVGSDFKEVKGNLANDYILRKADAFDLEKHLGIYHLGDLSSDFNKLSLSKLKKNVIGINLSSYSENDTIEKCHIKFEGKLNKENIIEVNLGNKKDSLQQMLKILFTIKEAHVYYENVPKDSIALKCSDSLNVNYQGTYLKY